MDIMLTDAQLKETVPAEALRSVHKLLWTAITEALNPSERDEIRRAVGARLIDDNEALFQEANALAEILGDVHQSTEALVARRNLCSNPERTMVEFEILMALERLRSCATTALFPHSAATQRDPDSVMPNRDAHDKAVYDYVVSAASSQPGRGCLRPGTSSSRPMTASSTLSSTFMLPRSRPSTASSATSASNVPDPNMLVKSMQGKLNIWAIDEIREGIQCAVQEEKAALLDDISFLTAVLSDETDQQAAATAPPPALQQLKTYSIKLKQLVNQEEQRLQQELVVSKMFDAAQTADGKAGRLRRMVSVARDPVPEHLPVPSMDLATSIDMTGTHVRTVSSRGSSAAAKRSGSSLSVERDISSRPSSVDTGVSSMQAKADVLVVHRSQAGVNPAALRSTMSAKESKTTAVAVRKTCVSPGFQEARDVVSRGSSASSKNSRVQPVSEPEPCETKFWGSQGGCRHISPACSPPRPTAVLCRSSSSVSDRRRATGFGNEAGMQHTNHDRPPRDCILASQNSAPVDVQPVASGPLKGRLSAIQILKNNRNDPGSLKAMGSSHEKYEDLDGLSSQQLSLTNKKPVVGSLLDAQVDVLKGGVQAILAKHNYRVADKTLRTSKSFQEQEV